MPDFLTTITQNSGETLSIVQLLLSFFTPALCGVLIGVTYTKSNKTENVQRNFVLTLFMLPVIMSMIILFVGSNIARAFSLAGTVAIIRFRSTSSDPKDIGYVFFSVASGLACGIGFYFYGLLFTLGLCMVLFLLEKTNFGKQKQRVRLLKITIPEDLNYEDAFSDIFNAHTKSITLNAIKTADLGSVFVLSYHAVLTPETNEKALIDKIRCRNGNLTVMISEIPAVIK